MQRRAVLASRFFFIDVDSVVVLCSLFFKRLILEYSKLSSLYRIRVLTNWFNK